jgi:hypothetical protein
MRRRSIASFLIPLATAAGCATPTPYDPYLIPRSEFGAKVRTLALAGPWVSSDIEDPEPVKETFARLIQSKLQRMGFETVAWEEQERIWEQTTTDVGGFFDPLTGKRDEEKFEVVRRHMLDELEREFGADALLHASLGVMAAEFSNSDAHWCGASQSVKTGGRQWLEALGGSTSGSVAAVAVFVVIEDMSGTDLYKDCGGIELTAKLTASGFEEIPRYQLFLDAGRNGAGVGLALDALGEAFGTESSPPPGADAGS